MRAVIQRVRRASVEVEQEIVSQIGQGLLVLLGVESTDSRDDIGWLAGKIARLRIFTDQNGAMNLSVQEIAGDLLVVSQFTLFASTRKGNRPSFIAAAAPDQANKLYEEFCRQLETEVAKTVRRGIFGAHMRIDLVNDGPVTISIDSKRRE
jgi:D-tyrosyl-tRNA(Tyr) deacylase